MMMDCDTLLTVGSSFPYTQFLPEFDQARAVQIDIDGKYIGMRYPYEVNLVGDAAATLRALIPQLKRKDDRGWRETIESNVARWWEVMDAEAMVDGRPGQPDAAVLRAVPATARQRDRLRRLRIRRQLVRPATEVPRRHARLAVGQPGHHGPGVPYGIGAKFGNPDRPVIVFAGDGAMQMNGMAELITIKHYWQAVDRPAAGRSRSCTTTTSTRSPGRCARWKGRRSSPSPRPCPTSTSPASPPASACRRSPSTDPGRGRPGVAARPGRGPAHGARRAHRPQRAADPAARHLRTDERRRRGIAQGRRGPVGHHQGRRQDQGPGVPAAQGRRTARRRVAMRRRAGPTRRTI